MTGRAVRDGSYWSYPYHDYDALRRESPVDHDPYLEAWLVTSHDAAAEALRHPGLSSAWMEHREDAAVAGADLVHRVLRRWFVLTDEPDHTRLRAAVGRIFAARTIEALRPRIEARVEELFDAALAHGRAVDVVTELAFPLSASIINGLVGLDPAHERLMPRWGSVLARYLAHASGTDALAETTTVLGEIEDAIRSRLQDERLEPGAVIHRFVDTDGAGGGDLDEGVLEAVGTASFLLYAGMETTSLAVGLITLTLLERPELRAAIDPADAGALARAVDELLRYDTPVLQVPRIAATDLELAGVRIPRGDLVVIVLGAANHDPARYAAPHDVDLDPAAPAGRHLTFGLGAHYCIGAALARIELETYLAALLRRAPRLMAVAPPTWTRTSGVRVLESLLVDLDPRPSSPAGGG